jgi:hypothetical protein
MLEIIKIFALCTILIYLTYFYKLYLTYFYKLYQFTILIIILIWSLFIPLILGINFKSCFPYPKSSSILSLESCFHGVPGLCTMCIAASKAAAVKRTALVPPITIPHRPAFGSSIANCEHRWMWISDDAFWRVACDFSLPIHEIQGGLVNYCQYCHAIACMHCA